MISRLPLLVSEKEVREKRQKRYTQKEIAEETGLSPSVISRWMRGGEIFGPQLETAHTLAKWLGVDIEELTIIIEEPA